MQEATSRRVNAVLHHLSAFQKPDNLEEFSTSASLNLQECSRSHAGILALEEERENVSFDVRKLTYLLDGGKETTKVLVSYY